MTIQEILSIWAMAILMIAMTFLLGAIIWVVIDGIRESKR